MFWVLLKGPKQKKFVLVLQMGTDIFQCFGEFFDFQNWNFFAEIFASKLLCIDKPVRGNSSDPCETPPQPASKDPAAFHRDAGHWEQKGRGQVGREGFYLGYSK